MILIIGCCAMFVQFTFSNLFVQKCNCDDYENIIFVHFQWMTSDRIIYLYLDACTLNDKRTLGIGTFAINTKLIVHVLYINLKYKISAI